MKNLNLIKRLWTDSHEKQKPQRFRRYAGMLLMLLTLGAGQMWGDITITGGYVYYNDALTNFKSTHNYLACLQSNWFSTTEASNAYITNTKLMYFSAPNHTGWGGEKGVCVFTHTSEWGNQGNPYSTITTYSSHYTEQKAQSLSSGTYYLFTPSSSSNGTALSVSSNATSATSLLKKTYTIKAKVKKAGSNSYVDASAENGMPASSVTVTAYYINGTTSATSNEVTLSGTTYSTTFYGSPGAKITLSQTAEDDYTFDGFYVSSSSITSPYYPTSANAITIEARYTENKYIVTYHANGKDGGGAKPTDGTAYSSGATVTVKGNVNGMTKTGHVFAGWNTKSDGSGDYYAPGATFSITEDTDIYAMWLDKAVLDGTNVMFYYQGYCDGNCNNRLVKGKNDILSGSNNLGSGYGYAHTAKSNLTSYYFISNNPSDWGGKENADIKTASGGELFIANSSTSTTPAKTATTTPTPDGTNLSISTTCNSATGVYNSKSLYILYYMDNEIVAVTYSGTPTMFIPASTSARASSISGLADGDYTMKTILTDGLVYYVAETDEFTISSATRTLTYDGNGAASGSAPSGSGNSYALNTYVTVASNTFTARTNYSFGGWNTSPYIDGTPYAAGSSIQMTDNITLYAKWNRTVTLDPNGGSGGSSSVVATWNCSTLPSITNPGRTGYTFAEWNTQADGNGNIVINSSGQLQADKTNWTDADGRFKRTPSGASSESKPLYAKWSAKQYNITLDKKEGSSGGTAKVKYDATSLTNIFPPSRTGYSVEGYYGETGRTNKVAASNGALQSDVTGFTTGNVWKKDADGTITLYTNWTPNPYTITFDPNGGTVDPTSASVTYDAAISNAPVPTKTGYNFTGYNTAGGVSITTNTGVFKANVSTFTDASAHWIKDADATITAQWTPKQTNVTLDQQSGSGGSGSVTATYGSSMPAATMPTYTGYDFDGYYTSTGGGGTKYYNANGSSAKNWNFEDATKTLYAKWTVHNYTITYNLDGGDNSGSNPDTYTIEDALITLQDPSKTGYDFAGWYTNSEKTIPGNTIAAGSHENKTFYAKWTVKNYNITYSPVSAPSGVTYTTTPASANYGATVTMVITPESGKTIDVSAVDGSSNSVSITNSSANTYTFTMPASAVTVSVAVVTLPIVYVLKSKGTNACFPFGFTSGGSASQVKLWAWSTADGTPNFYTSNGEFPGNATAESKATEITDAHGNTWWRFMPNNTSYFDRSTEFSLIVYSTSSSQRIYESNANDHYVSDGLTRTTCNASTNYKFTGTVWVVPGGTSAHSATLYYENPSSPKKFVFVEGRFKVYTDKTRTTAKYTGDNEGDWNETSRNIRMLYDETNSRYYLHTYCTPNELKSIKGNPSYINLHTSSVVTGFSNHSRYYLNTSGQNLESAGQKRYFTNTSDVYRTCIDNSTTNKYVVLYWDESQIWYEEEPIPAAITSIGLSSNRVPPMATITATPNMASKRNVDQAYCWGVYTDAACTEGNKVDVTFTSLGDSKVQFTVPQTIGTYYLKLTIRASAACDASIDDEEVQSFNVTTDNMVFFKNVPNWGSVHVYFLGASEYWNSDKGTGCQGRDWGHAHGMSRIGNSDVYYYDYTGNSNAISGYIAFTDNYKPNSEFFSGCQAAYRGDFDRTCAPMYVPENYITDYKNTSAGDGQAAYYNRGYWTKYMNTGSAYTLHVYTLKDGGSEVFSHEFTGTVGSNTYSYTYDFKDVSESMPYIYYMTLVGCNGSTYGAADDMDISKCTNWNFYTQTRRCGLKVQGKLKHTFILTLTGDGHIQLSVEYPVTIGDYRLVYDDDTQTPHPSQYIRKRANGKDTISMFVRTRDAIRPSLKVQTCTGISGETITWGDYNWNSGSAAVSLTGLDTAGVYNFYLEQDGEGNLTVNTAKTEPYSGRYYIRTSVVDGGWNSYKSTSDNLMTYAQYPDDRGYGFNYYKAKWVGATGSDVTYTIACDYSPSLCDTLLGDPGDDPLDDDEVQSIPHTANVRFGWHSKTNALKREYINGSTNISDRFLVMIGDAKMKDKDGKALNISGLNANEISFTDLNNWIYRCDITAVEGAEVKLTANYNDKIQYFIGTAGEGEEILGGTGSKEYLMRVTYDFKTNRLMTAWLPNGSQIEDNITLKADMMLIREGQNAATQVYFNGNGKSISEIHTIYGVMEFQYDNIAGKFPSWSSTNAYKYLMYYISFPFDVKVSEIFGCGVRGENWIVQKYNGAKRAQIGWFAETSTFWETLPGDSTLHAYEGYLLLLDRVSFNDPSSSLWYKQGSGNSIYLYFPSSSHTSGTISEASKTIHVPEHTCTINRTFDVDGVGTVNHKNTDSHWNVIGTPLFEDKVASNIATPSADGAGARTLQYYYAWNSADNTLAAQAAFNNTVTFKSMHSYMVQYAGDVTFTGAKLTPPTSVAARRLPSDQNYQIELQMVNEGGKTSRTYVELRENACDTFALNEDMYMMRSSKMVDLYSFAGNYDVAANVLSVNNHIVPVGMDVKVADTYRFTMPSEFDGSVVLIDTYTGARTNLALGDYEVNLERGTANDRFLLEINIHNAPTTIEGIEGGSLKDGKAHKFVQDGVMYILRDGKIYDARGAMVK